ncbi:MAG: PIN domain-containing protein [Methanoregula sp.]|nr:PIN domain-containing protein [Methanoregula sp.]
MNKREIFLDTSFVVAIINNDDQFHKAALNLEKDLKTYVAVWITEAILIEIGNTFSKSNKGQVSDFIQYCYVSPQIHVVNTDEGVLRQALDLFKYNDKDWSLTDCISFVVMKKEGIDIAYSSDHHFEQAGFHYILKSG